MTRGSPGPLGRRFWTPEEDALLEELAGQLGITRIAERLHRTVASVGSHAAIRGISLRPEGTYSLNELVTILGNDHYRIIRSWVESGLLRGHRNRGRGRWGTFHVDEEALVAFLQANPHLVDRDRVDPAYRQFVDERWITLGEAFRRGAAHVLSLEHAYRAGLLPRARRRGLRIVIPESVLPVLVEGRRQLTPDLEHRRQWAVYAAQQRRRRPIRRRQWEEAQSFDAEPIVSRLLAVGRVRRVRTA